MKKKAKKTPCTTLPVRLDDAEKVRRLGAARGWNLITTMSYIIANCPK